MNDTKRSRYLQAMGIHQWELRSNNPEPINIEEAAMPAPKKISIPGNERLQSIAQMDWAELEAAVTGCKACDLYKTRTKTVFGVGDRQADLLVVGEAPGANEDKQGEPFVGRAGQLLNSMLQSIGLSRQQIYIANVVKSRPPENRDPTPEEVKACIPYLQRQIQLIQPKLILTVGRIAAQHLLGVQESMGQLRGRHFTYGTLKTPVIVTYHPAYLLRSPREKRKAWMDMQQVANALGIVSR